MMSLLTSFSGNFYVKRSVERRKKMGKNKQRTAVNRKVNKLLFKFGNKCE